MKKIFLYSGRGKAKKQTDIFAMVDDEDFEYLNQFKWGLMKLYHCDTSVQYARRYEYKNKKLIVILMHRFILGLINGNEKCDHKDGVGLNCQRNNLRKCTHSQNMSYRINRKTNKNKWMGVQKQSKSTTFFSSCKHNNIVHRISGFNSEIEAALGYNYLAHKLHGEFAKLNDIYI